MSYYDSHISEQPNNTESSNNAVYSEEIAEKVAMIRNPDTFKSIFDKTKTSVNATIIMSLVGVGYALYKHKNVILWGAIGGVSGMLAANIFNKFYTIKKTDKDENTKPSS